MREPGSTPARPFATRGRSLPCPGRGMCATSGAVMIDEFDEELRELKREIIEARGLIIKTNNLTNALSADLKSIAKRQQGYERRLVWNSATAYVVFVVVVFVALKLA